MQLIDGELHDNTRRGVEDGVALLDHIVLGIEAPTAPTWSCRSLEAEYLIADLRAVPTLCQLVDRVVEMRARVRAVLAAPDKAEKRELEELRDYFFAIVEGCLVRPYLGRRQ